MDNLDNQDQFSTVTNARASPDTGVVYGVATGYLLSLTIAG